MNKIIKISIALALLSLYILILVGMSSALVIKSVSTNPAEIAQGETSVIKIELENEGDEDTTDVSVVLDLANVPFAPYGSSSEESINEIEEDDSETVTLRVIALNNAGSGIYKIPISVSYKEGDNVKTKNSLIGLTINSRPILSVNIEGDLLLKGKKNELNVKIINKGLSDVRFLEVEIGSSSYIDVLSLKNIYVGDLDSDDFDSVEFNAFFDKKTPDNLNIPVILTYKDSTNKEFSETFSAPVNVYTRERAIELGLMQQNYTLYYIAGGVVLVVLFFVYRSWRRRRRLKRANEKEF